jgi:hypothetical protein
MSKDDSLLGDLAIYVIKNKIKDGTSIEEAVEFVNKALKRKFKVEEVSAILEEKKNKKANHMINKTASGQKGIAVMTKAQSELTDENRNNIPSKNYLSNNIHKINDYEEN